MEVTLDSFESKVVLQTAEVREKKDGNWGIPGHCNGFTGLHKGQQPGSS